MERLRVREGIEPAEKIKSVACNHQFTRVWGWTGLKWVRLLTGNECVRAVCPKNTNARFWDGCSVRYLLPKNGANYR